MKFLQRGGELEEGGDRLRGGRRQEEMAGKDVCWKNVIFIVQAFPRCSLTGQAFPALCVHVTIAATAEVRCHCYRSMYVNG